MSGLGFQVGHRLDSQQIQESMPTKRDRSLSARGNGVRVPCAGPAQLAGRGYSSVWVGASPQQQVYG